MKEIENDYREFARVLAGINAHEQYDPPLKHSVAEALGADVLDVLDWASCVWGIMKGLCRMVSAATPRDSTNMRESARKSMSVAIFNR